MAKKMKASDIKIKLIPKPYEPQLVKVLKLLDEAYAADPRAMQQLLNVRIPCKKKLAEHPTIPCAGLTIGTLGLINGILMELFGRKVASKITNRGRLTGFQAYDSNSVQYRVTAPKSYWTGPNWTIKGGKAVALKKRK